MRNANYYIIKQKSKKNGQKRTFFGHTRESGDPKENVIARPHSAAVAISNTGKNLLVSAELVYSIALDFKEIALGRIYSK